MASSVLPFLNRERGYIVVWPGDDECVMEIFGERYRVPATDDVSDFGQPGSRYRLPPARDEAGKPIPGTVILADRWGRDEGSNEEVKKIDAGNALLLLHARNAPLLNRGLTVVENVKDVEAVREAGRPRWVAATIKQWEQILNAELERQEHWAKKGRPAPESSSAQSVKDAIAGLKAARFKMGETISKTDILEALGSGPVKGAFDVPVATEDEALDIGKAAEDLFVAAETAGLTLTKPELKGLLAKDESVMEQVAEKLQALKTTT